VLPDRRLPALRAALAFLQVRPRVPELQRVHRWLDNWNGVGLIVAGMTRHGFQLGLDQRTGYTPPTGGRLAFHHRCHEIWREEAEKPSRRS
jgi:hypothetical protein